MAWRPHGRTRIDPLAPRARAVCDQCGFQLSHSDLRPEVQWMGASIRPTGYLVCPDCLDVPQPQLASQILPPDPVPILNPRSNYGDD